MKEQNLELLSIREEDSLNRKSNSDSEHWRDWRVWVTAGVYASPLVYFGYEMYDLVKAGLL